MVVPTMQSTGGETSTLENRPDQKIWDDLDEALEELDAAIPEYQKAEAYYEGTVTEKFLNKAVQALLTGSDTDFRVHLAGRVVDAVTARTEIDAVTGAANAEPEAEEESERKAG